MTRTADSSGTERGDLRRGAIIVAVGIWLLGSSLGVAGLDYSNSWPVLMMLIGLVLVLFPTGCDGRAGGVSLMAWGALMFVAVHGLWGFHWMNVWPLVLVVVGAGIVWRAIAGRNRRRVEVDDG